MNFKKSNTVGDSIAAARKAAGLSQESLAAQLHVTRQTISNWESGKSAPDIESLKALAETLSVPVEQLIYGKQKDRPGLESDDLLAAVCSVLAKAVLIIGFLMGCRSGSGSISEGNMVSFHFFWGNAFPVWAFSVITSTVLAALAKILRLLEHRDGGEPLP